MKDILIVEDDEAIANLIYMNLTEEKYNCTIAVDGEKAADLIEINRYDLVLLDVMLPEINGYELLEYIKDFNTPVIFLTAKTSIADKIKGLKLGAEDYITKPFIIEELLARIEVVLRRNELSKKDMKVLDITIDTCSRKVFKNNEEIELTAKEFDLLCVLVKNKNKALTREVLYENVWKEEYLASTRTLDLHIQRLRKKLKWEDNIKTVFRIGYRLEV